MAIELPKTKIKAELQDPRYVIIFGKSKIGKSTALSNLPNNLIIDLEEGYKYIDALKVEAHNLNDLKDIAKAIKDAGCPYKYITLDTITALEDIVKPLALKLYLDTPAGSKFTSKDVLDAPMGRFVPHIIVMLYANTFNCWKPKQKCMVISSEF